MKKNLLSSATIPKQLHTLKPQTTTCEQEREAEPEFHAEVEKPSFHYDLEVFNQCKHYLETKNQYGLALIARQKGIPPFLRFKVWPILLRYHPYVMNPFIQPTTDANANAGEHKRDPDLPGTKTASQHDDEFQTRVRRDLKKYVTRLLFGSSSSIEPSEKELEMLAVMEKAIMRFCKKWGAVIKYHPSLTWIALNLAEWLPPVPQTLLVLAGRDVVSSNNLFAVDLFDDYSNYIDNIRGLKEYLDAAVNSTSDKTMLFLDVYERLVLVLMHSPEEKAPKTSGVSIEATPAPLLHVLSDSWLPLLTLIHRRASILVADALPAASRERNSHSSSSSESNHSLQHVNSTHRVNKSLLPINGGNIEERVSFFIYCFRKVLPELSEYFHEEQILNKFGSHDDGWLIWWLNYCGAKAWSKFDRGRIWDMLLGWRLKNPKRNTQYYVDKLDLTRDDSSFVQKMGPDVFWSLSNSGQKHSSSEESGENTTAHDQFATCGDGNVSRRSSFKDLVDELSSPDKSLLQDEDKVRAGAKKTLSETMDCSQSSPSSGTSLRSSLLLYLAIDATEDSKPKITSLPFAKLDAHVQLIFIALAFLKSKQNLLMELDQHEIRQFLLRLPSKSYLYNQGKRRTTTLGATQGEGNPREPKNPTPDATGLRSRSSSISNLSETGLHSASQSSCVIISNDSVDRHKVDFMNNIIEEAGDLWRKWLWSEMVEDN